MKTRMNLKVNTSNTEVDVLFVEKKQKQGHSRTFTHTLRGEQEMIVTANGYTMYVPDKTDRDDHTIKTLNA